MNPVDFTQKEIENLERIYQQFLFHHNSVDPSAFLNDIVKFILNFMIY